MIESHQWGGGCTFLLFTLAPLVALVDTLDGAHGENDGYDEEEDAADDAGRDGLVFDAARDHERDLLARRLTCQRVRVDTEDVRLARIQTFHWKRNRMMNVTMNSAVHETTQCYL